MLPALAPLPFAAARSRLSGLTPRPARRARPARAGARLGPGQRAGRRVPGSPKPPSLTPAERGIHSSLLDPRWSHQETMGGAGPWQVSGEVMDGCLQPGLPITATA